MLGATGMGTVVTFVTGGTVTSYARITGIAGIARGAARVAHFQSGWIKAASGSGTVQRNPVEEYSFRLPEGSA